MNPENTIYTDAIQQLVQIIDLQVEARPYPGQKDNDIDRLLRLCRNEEEWFFTAEIKKTMTTNTVIQLAEQLAHRPQKTLLITPYVNPKMADQLKDRNIPFVDTIGNAYLNEEGLYVFIKGNKPKDHLLPGKTTLARPFKPTGLKVTFALLTNPRLCDENYRNIAAAAKVALGTVAGVMTDLKKLAYIIEIDKNHFRLTKGKELLNKWVDAYITYTRPTLIIERYQTAENDFTWRDAKNLEDINGLIGGEVAADALTHLLKPETLTIYTDEPLGPMLLRHGLRRDPNGNVEILVKFWNFEFPFFGYKQLVHPILIYADLIAAGDDRLMEIARREEITKKLLEGEYFEINGKT